MSERDIQAQIDEARRQYRDLRLRYLGDLTPRQKIAKECGRLVLCYAVLALIGVCLGWLWAFLALTALYLTTLALLWLAIKKAGKDAT